MGSIKEFKKSFVEKISSYYDEREANSIFFLAFEELSSYSKAQFLAKQDEAISQRLVEQLESIQRRLLKKEPIQYILKKAYFRGHEYVVNPAVLIPRPETEELVEWVLNTVGQDVEIKLLDIGTGSGCIPIELKREQSEWEIHAWDISEDALEIARTNAAKNGVEVHFVEQDICTAKDGSWNIIVSNPPYVPQRESKLLKAHVLEHEPHLALFSKTEDPLYFYKHIITYAEATLTGDGLIFLEGHELYMDELKDLFEEEKWSDIKSKKDFHEKPRMLSARRNG